MALASTSGIVVHPATHDRFDDLVATIGPKRPDPSVCWCLSHRIEAKANTSLHGVERGGYVERLTREPSAPAVEGYPVDDAGERVDLTMAYVGTRALFERAGFELAAPTDAVSGGFPRVVMRKQLAPR